MKGVRRGGGCHRGGGLTAFCLFPITLLLLSFELDPCLKVLASFTTRARAELKFTKLLVPSCTKLMVWSCFKSSSSQPLKLNLCKTGVFVKRMDLKYNECNNNDDDDDDDDDGDDCGDEDKIVFMMMMMMMMTMLEVMMISPGCRKHVDQRQHIVLYRKLATTRRQGW